MATQDASPPDRLSAPGFPANLPSSPEFAEHPADAVNSAPGVRQLLVGHKVVAFDAPLRGVEGNACVYRVLGT
jgi:hypothetical protein